MIHSPTSFVLDSFILSRDLDAIINPCRPLSICLGQMHVINSYLVHIVFTPEPTCIHTIGHCYAVPRPECPTRPPTRCSRIEDSCMLHIVSTHQDLSEWPCDGWKTRIIVCPCPFGPKLGVCLCMLMSGCRGLVCGARDCPCA